MKNLYLICLFLVISIFQSRGAVLADSTQIKKKVSLTPFPALFSTPETGIGYGALVIPVYNFGQDSLTRNSNGQLLAYYTQKKQAAVQFTYTIFTNAERYNISGDISYYDFAILYYGTGNKNTLADSSLISYKLLFFQNRVLRKIKNHVFLGAQVQVNQIKDLEFKNQDSKLRQRPTEELNGSVASGLGPAFLFDSRNNPLNTTRGLYLEAGTLFNHRILGSEFNFTRYTLDIRKFLPLSTHQVLAFQGVGTFSSGKVPFREMAMLGGGKIMRGFYFGRFRDRQLVALQSEYRHQLFNRLGLVAFASAGKVGHQGTDLGLTQVKCAAGAGLRLMLNRKERLNIRIDYAVGTDKANGFYFAIGEAF